MPVSLMGTSIEGHVPENDLLGAILRTVKGIKVSEDTLNFDLICDTVTGAGHYLGHPQTFARMKTNDVYPALPDRCSANEWQQAGGRGVREVARDQVKKFLGRRFPQHITLIDDKIRSNYNIILLRSRVRQAMAIVEAWLDDANTSRTAFTTQAAVRNSPSMQHSIPLLVRTRVSNLAKSANSTPGFALNRKS